MGGGTRTTGEGDCRGRRGKLEVNWKNNIMSSPDQKYLFGLVCGSLKLCIEQLLVLYWTFLLKLFFSNNF